MHLAEVVQQTVIVRAVLRTVDDLLRLLFLRADVGDDAVLHQQIAVGVHGVAGVAGDDVGCVFHQ